MFLQSYENNNIKKSQIHYVILFSVRSGCDIPLMVCSIGMRIGRKY
jgi:hypothetical protein